MPDPSAVNSLTMLHIALQRKKKHMLTSIGCCTTLAAMAGTRNNIILPAIASQCPNVTFYNNTCKIFNIYVRISHNFLCSEIILSQANTTTMTLSFVSNNQATGAGVICVISFMPPHPYQYSICQTQVCCSRRCTVISITCMLPLT